MAYVSWFVERLCNGEGVTLDLGSLSETAAREFVRDAKRGAATRLVDAGEIIAYRVRRTCPHCAGAPSAPGFFLLTCPTCKGAGHVTDEVQDSYETVGLIADRIADALGGAR